MTECNGTGSPDDVKKKTHTFSSTKLLTQVTVADKLVLVNPFLWNNHSFIVLCAVSSWFVQCTSLTVNINLSDVTNRYYTVLCRTVVVNEKKNWSLVFSGSRKIPTLESAQQASFPTGTVGPWVGIFLSPLNTSDGFHLSHIHVPAYRKDKKLTAARRPHAGCSSFCDIIVMLKWRHHVASQRIQDSLEAIFMFFQYKIRYLVVSKKKNPLFMWEWDRKLRPWRSTFVITRQASCCQSVILRRIFYLKLKLKLMIDSYSPWSRKLSFRLPTLRKICELFWT